MSSVGTGKSTTYRGLRALACLTLGALACLGVQARVKRVSLQECALQADQVFVGQVVRITTRWGDTNKMIWTDYLFRVEEGWKGRPGAFVTLSAAGGTVGNRSIYVTETPTFEIQGTYVVYAYDGARNYAAPVVGVEQGLFKEVTDMDTGRRVLIDASGYLMEGREDGSVMRGRFTKAIGDGASVHILNDAEIKAQQEAFEAQFPKVEMSKPIYRDAHGLPVAAPPEATPQVEPPAPSAPPASAPLTRTALREFTQRALAAAPESCAPDKGAKP